MKPEEFIEKIKNLSKEDLEFYQKLLKFFEFLGINETEFKNLIMLVKGWEEIVVKINAIIKDQQYINEKFINGKENKEELDGRNPLKELNSERQKLNIYGK